MKNNENQNTNENHLKIYENHKRKLFDKMKIKRKYENHMKTNNKIIKENNFKTMQSIRTYQNHMKINENHKKNI